LTADRGRAETACLDHRQAEAVVVECAHIASAQTDPQRHRAPIGGSLPEKASLDGDSGLERVRAGVEGRHHPVAEGLDEQSPMPGDLLTETGEVRPPQLLGRARIEPCQELCRPDDVGEHHGQGSGSHGSARSPLDRGLS
jgi:hypothetical protein